MLRIFLLALVFLTTACRKDRDLSQYTVEDKTPRLATLIQMSDPKAAPQVKEGFHQLEDNSWRWTEGRFSVDLRPPFGAVQSGAVLRLKGSLPDLLFSKTGPVTLQALIGQTRLTGVTLRQAGDANYETLVPAALLDQDPVRVTFVLDKFLKPNTLPGDGRELGLIVTEIGWETKK